MTLKEYMEEHRYSANHLSGLIGVSRASITEYRERRTTPTLEVAIKIVDFTGQKVTFAKLLRQDDDAEDQARSLPGLKKILSLAQVAKQLRTSQTFVAKECRLGRLRSAKVGREWRVREEDLVVYLEEIWSEVGA